MSDRRHPRFIAMVFLHLKGFLKAGEVSSHKVLETDVQYFTSERREPDRESKPILSVEEAADLETIHSGVTRETLPPVLKVEDMARILGIGRSLAYELCRQPGFPVVRLGDKVLRVPTDALFRWIERQVSGC